MERSVRRLGAVVLLAAAACGSKRERGPDLQITDESVRYKQGAALPTTSAIFDGKQVRLRVARGETFGLQVLTTKAQPSAVAVNDAAIKVQPFQQTLVNVKQGSTDMYGGGMRGAGAYADGLQAVGQPSGPLAWFDITVPATHPAGTVAGTVTVGGVALPLQIDIVDVQVRLDAPLRVWAYYDERELAWAAADQARCVAMFRQHGVLAATTLDAAQWPTYREQFEGARYVPVRMRKVDDAVAVKQIVNDWIAATQGSGIIPFAIPIDEPR
ncbi:MAG TPA: hypothetical protein PLF40_08265, partial [Kofleriaceae bacterium]|nr:hypothetical protein [Kofleriaceae bacterium]